MQPTFALVSPAGDRLELATSAGSASPFHLDDETAGLGFVGREVQIVASTTDGGRLRASRATSRSATLVVDVWGLTADAMTDNLRRLAAAVRRIEGRPLPRLVATYSDGTEYELPFVVETGAENLKRVPSGAVQVVALGIVAPDPYWTARDALTFPFGANSSSVPWLPNMAEMRLSSSSARGDLIIDNPGEIAAYPTWRLTGPTTRATVTMGSASWSIGPLDVGEIVTIDTRTNKVTLADGKNAYNRLGPAPRLFSLPPGSTSLSVTMTDATLVTSATCFFRPRMEVVI
ncbi:hypothetical protein MTE01_28910 [Microbacterium testaceum]|uniref:Siphovirus-type tail component C-terminal domain-containing protein n=1 Tax=Microbacterium testaceum TaxID=2033 RepID=A0A4Y3QND7_MICTE|nr:phage tail domain-containing protein [Microbacterium testaceum]GEB46946.1 hypothetical protein MTE01_28910 [Microbacterium testaceum]